MEAKELRIGNYVEHNNKWCYRSDDFFQDQDKHIFQFTDRDFYALGECTLFLENITPIPLTEEWLLRFGFIDGEILEFDDLLFDVGNSMRYNFEDSTIGMGYYGNIKIKYVHQLQNLYFALTGKELEIK
jgi:hypothetical protein